MENIKEYTINDLPKFSKWPARLLGIEPWEQKVKSKNEIDREYELESWGAYLKRIGDEGLNDEVTAHTLDNWQCESDTTILYSKNDEFFQDLFGNVYSEYVDVIKGYVNYFLPTEAVVELGCGYGSVILSIAEHLQSDEVTFLAAEYTPSGKELTKICAINQGIKIIVGHCNFMDEELTDLIIPDKSIVFTCVTACTLPKLPDVFIPAIRECNPKVVIHFEPIYAHHNRSTLIDMMRRRYVEANDYNRNLLNLLKENESKGRIRILIEDRAVIGINPLFPISVIAWEPIS